MAMRVLRKVSSANLKFTIFLAIRLQKTDDAAIADGRCKISPLCVVAVLKERYELHHSAKKQNQSHKKQQTHFCAEFNALESRL